MCQVEANPHEPFADPGRLLEQGRQKPQLLGASIGLSRIWIMFAYARQHEDGNRGGGDRFGTSPKPRNSSTCNIPKGSSRPTAPITSLKSQNGRPRFARRKTLGSGSPRPAARSIATSPGACRCICCPKA